MSEESFRFLGRSMPEVSIAIGLMLCLWGAAAYLISDMASITALIPAFMGIPIGFLGAMSIKIPEKRKTFMHISATFGLLCALGGLRLPMILMNDDSSNLLIASHAILLVLGGLYTYLCVQSFIWTRKQRDAADL